MISLVILREGEHCLAGMASGGYVCCRRAGHDGEHEFAPIDMVIVAAEARSALTDNDKEPARDSEPALVYGGRGWD